VNSELYNIDCEKAFKDLLPWFYKRTMECTPKYQALRLYESIALSFEQFCSTFYQSTKWNIKRINSQNTIGGLTWLLNDYFSPATPITITNNNVPALIINSLPIRADGELVEGWTWGITGDTVTNPITMSISSDSNADDPHFTVNVDAADSGTTVNLETLASIIDSQKKATKTYNINIV